MLDQPAEGGRLEVALLLFAEIASWQRSLSDQIGPVREPYCLTSMYIGPPVDRVNDRRQPRRPGLGARLVGDQVLPDLDQRMGEAVDDGVADMVSPRSAPS